MNWPVIKAVGLLVGSNIFMTFAWYAHLRDLKAKPWFIAAFISWLPPADFFLAVLAQQAVFAVGGAWQHAGMGRPESLEVKKGHAHGCPRP